MIVSALAGFFDLSGFASGARAIAGVLFFIAMAIILIVPVSGVGLGMPVLR